jgi:hypothetical protein
MVIQERQSGYPTKRLPIPGCTMSEILRFLTLPLLPHPRVLSLQTLDPIKSESLGKPRADLESGLSHFIIKKNGKVIGQVPEKLVNRYGRPLFQGLLYSDTPTQPLNVMEFIDEQKEELNQYEILAVNTVGLLSKPATLTIQ